MRTVPLLMHEVLKELEQIFKSGGTSSRISVPELLVPLLYPGSEENLIYALWYAFDYASRVGSKIKRVIGEADLGAYGRPDLILYVDDDVWCIEVKECIRELKGREIQQIFRYAECPYIDFLVVAYLKWCREDDDLTKSKIRYLLDRGIGVFYITPFGEIVFNENWAPYKPKDKRVIKIPIFSRYEEKLRYMVYKYFINKGFGVTLEAPLRDLEMTYYIHSLVSYERPRAIHRLPRIDLVMWDRKEDIDKLRFIGVEIKTGQVIDLQQIEDYRRSAMLSELYIAVPTSYAADVEQILSQHNLDDVGVIAIDEHNEKVEIIRESKAKSTTYKYYKYVQIKDGCLIVEDPLSKHKIRFPKLTPTEALYFGFRRT